MPYIELTLFRQYVILIFYDYLGHKELGEAVQRDDICPGLCSLWPPSRQCPGQQNWGGNSNSPSGSWIVSGITVDVLFHQFFLASGNFKWYWNYIFQYTFDSMLCPSHPL